MKHKIFKKNIEIICDNDNLNQLRRIQYEIESLERATKTPRLGYYCASTKTFPRGDEDALEYILMVIQGRIDPLYLPYRVKDESPVHFWRTFGKYFNELADYCEDKDNKLSKLSELKAEEKRLKEILNIK